MAYKVYVNCYEAHKTKGGCVSIRKTIENVESPYISIPAITPLGIGKRDYLVVPFNDKEAEAVLIDYDEK